MYDFIKNKWKDLQKSSKALTWAEKKNDQLTLFWAQHEFFLKIQNSHF